MMMNCGAGMMAFWWLGALLGVATLVSLLVLVWVAIGWMRRSPGGISSKA